MSESSFPISGRFVEPANVISHFHLREGDKVADFGAGSGHFIPILSEAVGGSGRVYALEIQKILTERIADLTAQRSLTNVEVIWCDLEEAGGTKIETDVLDAGILVNTLFQIEEKAIALEEIGRTLRPGAKLFVVDWSESFSGLGPAPDQVLTEQTATDLVEANGYVLERSFPTGDHHYGLAFRKL